MAVTTHPRRCFINIVSLRRPTHQYFKEWAAILLRYERRVVATGHPLIDLTPMRRQLFEILFAAKGQDDILEEQVGNTLRHKGIPDPARPQRPDAQTLVPSERGRADGLNH